MNSRRTIIICLIGLSLGLGLTGLEAQVRTNFIKTGLPTPPAPTLRSPVDSFRALLLLPAPERQKQLAARPPAIREQLLEKIREYQNLTAEERELRLKATELRWHLKPLMVLTPTNRADRLATIPTNLLPMVQTRLEQWDRIPPVVQQMMLTNQHGASYLASGSAANLYPPLPSDKIRQKFQERFEQIFEFTPIEKEKVLASLSDIEQRQMQKTLDDFQKLSPGQRMQCVRAFAKLSGMSLVERQEFLKNAERWAQMTPAERQSWRSLVNTAPQLPPLPQLISRKPPLPHGLSKPPPQTNSGG